MNVVSGKMLQKGAECNDSVVKSVLAIAKDLDLGKFLPGMIRNFPLRVGNSIKRVIVKLGTGAPMGTICAGCQSFL